MDLTEQNVNRQKKFVQAPFSPMKEEKLLRLNTSDWFLIAVIVWNKSLLKYIQFSPSALKEPQQQVRLKCRCLSAEADESQLKMPSQPQAFLYITGGESCTNKDGRVFATLAACRQRKLPVSWSCNSQWQSRKSNLLVVSLFLCEVSEFCRQDIGYNFYSASALSMFCSLNRHSSLLLLPEESHNYFKFLCGCKTIAHTRETPTQRGTNCGTKSDIAKPL